MKNNFIVNVSVVIFNGNNEVLLGHRSPQEEVYPDLWGIPGGKIESTDASIEDGLKREVLEEVGIEIKDIQMVSNNTRVKSDSQNVLYMVFKAKLASGVAQPIEDTDKVGWFTLSQMNELEFTPFTYDIIKKAFSKIDNL